MKLLGAIIIFKVEVLPAMEIPRHKETSLKANNKNVEAL